LQILLFFSSFFSAFFIFPTIVLPFFFRHITPIFSYFVPYIQNRILQSRNTYAPLDTSYPQKRIQTIFDILGERMKALIIHISLWKTELFSVFSLPLLLIFISKDILAISVPLSPKISKILIIIIMLTLAAGRVATIESWQQNFVAY